jgi:hypothetical protein
MDGLYHGIFRELRRSHRDLEQSRSQRKAAPPLREDRRPCNANFTSVDKRGADANLTGRETCQEKSTSCTSLFFRPSEQTCKHAAGNVGSDLIAMQALNGTATVAGGALARPSLVPLVVLDTDRRPADSAASGDTPECV